MTTNHSDKSNYPSKYGGGWVTAAQYITECICAKRSKDDLPAKFWQLDSWKKIYRDQIFSARALLKLYSARAIITALQDNRAWNIYSLRAPHLDDIIKEKQRIIDSQVDVPTLEVTHSADAKPGPQFANKKSILNRIKEAENE